MYLRNLNELDFFYFQLPMNASTYTKQFLVAFVFDLDNFNVLLSHKSDEIRRTINKHVGLRFHTCLSKQI